jgi:hypothetical protein
MLNRPTGRGTISKTPMIQARRSLAIPCAPTLLAVTAAHAQQPYTSKRTYGCGGHASHHTALEQRNKSTVAKLEIA